MNPIKIFLITTVFLVFFTFPKNVSSQISESYVDSSVIIRTGATQYIIPKISVINLLAMRSEVITVTTWWHDIDYTLWTPGYFGLFNYSIVKGNMTEPDGAINDTLNFTNLNNGNYTYLYSFNKIGIYRLDITAENSTLGSSASRAYIYVGFITIPSGGGGGYFGVPIQLDISNITIQSIIPSSSNISFILTNRGYINPTMINIKQKLSRRTILISPTMTEIYSNSSTILLDYMKTINSTFSWFGSLPDGIYEIQISGVSVVDSRVTSTASFLFNYTNGQVIPGNETIYSFTPTPSIGDMLNDPNVKVIIYGVGVVGIGAVSLILIREWIFKKKRKQPVTTPQMQ